jgi:hypothetical protein
MSSAIRSRAEPPISHHLRGRRSSRPRSRRRRRSGSITVTCRPRRPCAGSRARSTACRLLDLALAELLALGGEEGVGHRAADRDRRRPALNSASSTSILSDTLAPPSDRQCTADRRRRAAATATSISLAITKPAPLLRDERHHAGGRGVRAVGGAERVVDVDVGVADASWRANAFVVGLFAGVEAEVLEQRDLAVAQIADDLARAVADRLVGQHDVGGQELGQPRRDRLERELGLDLDRRDGRGASRARSARRFSIRWRIVGSTATMRASSLTLRSLVSGTLRSTRTNTRRPSTGSCSTWTMPWGSAMTPTAAPRRTSPGRTGAASSPSRCRTRPSP